MMTPVIEAEGQDRDSLVLPGTQLDLIQATAQRTNASIVVVLIHGGPLDVEWLQNSPRVGAILTAWYPGQVRTACCLLVLPAVEACCVLLQCCLPVLVVLLARLAVLLWVLLVLQPAVYGGGHA